MFGTKISRCVRVGRRQWSALTHASSLAPSLARTLTHPPQCLYPKRNSILSCSSCQCTNDTCLWLHQCPCTCDSCAGYHCVYHRSSWWEPRAGRRRQPIQQRGAECRRKGRGRLVLAGPCLVPGSEKHDHEADDVSGTELAAFTVSAESAVFVCRAQQIEPNPDYLHFAPCPHNRWSPSLSPRWKVVVTLSRLR